MKKIGFAGVTAFQLTVLRPNRGNYDYIVQVNYRYTAARQYIMVCVDSPLAKLSTDSMLLPVKALIQAVHPEYGIGCVTESGMEDPAIDRTQTGWSNFAETDRVWRNGMLREVFPWNFVSERQLLWEVEGMPLLLWIEAAPSRGEISTMSDNLFLWSISPGDLPAVRSTLQNSGMIFDPEKYLAEYLAETEKASQQAPAAVVPKEEIKDHKEKLVKRNKLIAKIMSLSKQGPKSYVLAVVGLDEFFDGNWDEFSLAPNMADCGRPSLQECYRILSAIRNRKEVQNVLVAIHETPYPDETDAFDTWPDSDTVYILTSCSLKEVTQWTKALVSDETNDMGKKWLTNSDNRPAGAPDLQPGMKIYTLWWD